MLLSRQALAYRLETVLALIDEELARGAAADTKEVAGLLRLACADAAALRGEYTKPVAGGVEMAARRPALRLVQGGRSD